MPQTDWRLGLPYRRRGPRVVFLPPQHRGAARSPNGDDEMPTKTEYIPTGFESYSKAERLEMAKRIEFDLRQERHNADGGGLRAEIARANVRTFEKQIKELKRTKGV